MEGVGRLVAFTSISIGPPSMVQQGYGRDNPYCTGVVELKEKTRVVARLKGVDSLNPDTIKVGLPVKDSPAETDPPAIRAIITSKNSIFFILTP